MKKVVLLMFLTACLGGSAQAGLATFTFDTLYPGGAGDAGIGSYMTGVYGAAVTGGTVTVTGATSYPYLNDGTLVNPLPALATIVDGQYSLADQYLADTGKGKRSFSISFSVPITSLTFDWARQDDPFQVEAWYGTTTKQIFSVETGSTGGTGNGTETINLLDPAIFGSPVTRLVFHDGGQGAIGIDNLTVVSVVPLPASILLGVFAVGLAARKLRQRV